MRASFEHFVDHFGAYAMLCQKTLGTGCGNNLKAERLQDFDTGQNPDLVVFAHGDKDFA